MVSIFIDYVGINGALCVVTVLAPATLTPKYPYMARQRLEITRHVNSASRLIYSQPTRCAAGRELTSERHAITLRSRDCIRP
jgi:hypothetical protein